MAPMAIAISGKASSGSADIFGQARDAATMRERDFRLASSMTHAPCAEGPKEAAASSARIKILICILNRPQAQLTNVLVGDRISEQPRSIRLDLRLLDDCRPLFQLSAEIHFHCVGVAHIDGNALLDGACGNGWLAQSIQHCFG